MKKVAGMIRKHFDGVIAWAQTRQTNGFLEAINGLFQAANRKARGYGRFQTMRVVIFLVPGYLNFSPINPLAAQPVQHSKEPGKAFSWGVSLRALRSDPGGSMILLMRTRRWNSIPWIMFRRRRSLH